MCSDWPLGPVSGRSGRLAAWPFGCSGQRITLTNESEPANAHIETNANVLTVLCDIGCLFCAFFFFFIPRFSAAVTTTFDAMHRNQWSRAA